MSPYNVPQQKSDFSTTASVTMKIIFQEKNLMNRQEPTEESVYSCAFFAFLDNCSANLPEADSWEEAIKQHPTFSK